MKKIHVIIMIIFALHANAITSGWTNQKTGIMELLTGDIRLNEIFSAAGIIVGPDCKLTVDGDVNAGAMFISRGGDIEISGKLTADIIYFDSANGKLTAEIGEIASKYYTQCGGTVKIKGNIVARTNGDDDGKGIININNEFAAYNKSRLTVDGGIFARGGDMRIGSLPIGDEAFTASFFAVRGISIYGYDVPDGGEGFIYINARKGLVATEGGIVIRDYM